MEIEPVNYDDVDSAMDDLSIQFKSWPTDELIKDYQLTRARFYLDWYRRNIKPPEYEENRLTIITTCISAELRERGIPFEQYHY